MCCKALQSCPTLCDPMDCSPPGKTAGVGCHAFLGLPDPGIEDLPDPGIEDLPDPGMELKSLKSPALQMGSFPLAAAKSLQSCPTLCDPIDGSPPGSPIPRILQAKTLEWVAISFSNP